MDRNKQSIRKTKKNDTEKYGQAYSKELVIWKIPKPLMQFSMGASCDHGDLSGNQTALLFNNYLKSYLMTLMLLTRTHSAHAHSSTIAHICIIESLHIYIYMCSV